MQTLPVEIIYKISSYLCEGDKNFLYLALTGDDCLVLRNRNVPLCEAVCRECGSNKYNCFCERLEFRQTGLYRSHYRKVTIGQLSVVYPMKHVIIHYKPWRMQGFKICGQKRFVFDEWANIEEGLVSLQHYIKKSRKKWACLKTMKICTKFSRQWLLINLNPKRIYGKYKSGVFLFNLNDCVKKLQSLV